MSVLRYFKKLQFLDSLIRKKATGNQQEFANKANISRGSLNIYLREMKELGFPISYSRQRNTYYYKEEGRMVNTLFEILDTEEQKHRRGGLDIVSMATFYLETAHHVA